MKKQLRIKTKKQVLNKLKEMDINDGYLLQRIDTLFNRTHCEKYYFEHDLGDAILTIYGTGKIKFKEFK